MKDRQSLLRAWIGGRTGVIDPALLPLAGDASQRRYFRIQGSGLIAADAPPETEKNREFLAVAEHLARAGLVAPRVHHADLERGFLLLSDLGDRTYGSLIEAGAPVDGCYRRAIDALVRLQATPCEALGLPAFDQAFCARELAIFNEWFVGPLLGLRPWEGFADLGAFLWASIDEQPRTFMHRDYHSRNLMATADAGPGILDFQDAVWGPVSYDLVSLLRDCYVTWEPAVQRAWTEYYLRGATAAGVLPPGAAARFGRWFDLTGLQRHLKCLGIFARLSRRDGKHHYLQHLPRVFRYVKDVAACYAELADFHRWLQLALAPGFTDWLQRREDTP